MTRGTTPTFTLTLPDNISLDEANNVYVTFAKQSRVITKSGDDLEINGNVVGVFLSQEETLKFPVGDVELQVNWTFIESGVTKRACTEIVRICVKQNLIQEVLE